MPDFEDSYSFYPKSPRTVKGGIKAQSSRGKFAKSWWAHRWLAVLESFKIATRLVRGRNYARKGQVRSIDIELGLVRASVQGSYPEPYAVEIRVKTIAPGKWEELSSTEFSQALTAAKLLAGEMPEDVEKLFDAKGLSLFPRKSDDLKTNCSCPDFSNPCKHIAAVYYLLGEEFDRDPFLIFKLRGMEKDVLLSLILGAFTQQESETFSGKSNASSKSKSQSKPQSKSGSNSDQKRAGRPRSRGLDLEPGLHSKEDGKSKIESVAQPVPGDYAPGIKKSKKSKKGTFEKDTDQSVQENWRSYWTSVPISDDLIGPIKVPPVAAALPKRLGNIPFWRAREQFIAQMEVMYSNASESITNTLTDVVD